MAGWSALFVPRSLHALPRSHDPRPAITRSRIAVAVLLALGMSPLAAQQTTLPAVTVSGANRPAGPGSPWIMQPLSAAGAAVS